MKLEAIFEEWEKDSQIDKTELADESLKIPSLHHKYYRMYAHERLVLKKYESEMKQLRLDKWEFYTQGPSEETRDKGWELPAKGLILKQEMPMYMEADKDIIDLSLRIGMQQEKVDLLDSIIKSFTNRGFNIKSAIDFIRFTSGV